MLKVVGTAFLSGLGAGVATALFFEIRGAAGWASARLIRVAARMLPDSVRADRQEEWTAEYEHWKDGAIGRLLWTLGLLLAAMRFPRPERGASARSGTVGDRLQLLARSQAIGTGLDRGGIAKLIDLGRVRLSELSGGRPVVFTTNYDELIERIGPLAESWPPSIRGRLLDRGHEEGQGPALATSGD